MTGPVFDLHQHVGGIEGIKALGKFSAAFPATEEAIATDQAARLEAMEVMGIDQAAIMPTHSYQRPNGLKDTCAVHDALIRYREMNPDRFPALFGTMEPRYGEDGLDEIDRIAKLGFQGISWHNRFQGLPVDHPVMHSFIARSHAVGLVPLIHCIVSDFEAVWRLRVLAEQSRDGIFICADGLTNTDNFDAVIATAEGLPEHLFRHDDLGRRQWRRRALRRAHLGRAPADGHQPLFRLAPPDHDHWPRQCQGSEADRRRPCPHPGRQRAAVARAGELARRAGAV